jgi:hypothetical protein
MLRPVMGGSRRFRACHSYPCHMSLAGFYRALSKRLSQAIRSFGKAKKITNRTTFLLLFSRNGDFSGSSLREHAARHFVEEIGVERILVEQIDAVLKREALGADIGELALRVAKFGFGRAPGNEPARADDSGIAEIGGHRATDRGQDQHAYILANATTHSHG